MPGMQKSTGDYRRLEIRCKIIVHFVLLLNKKFKGVFNAKIKR